MSMDNGVTLSIGQKLSEAATSSKTEKKEKVHQKKQIWGLPQREPEFITSLFSQTILQLATEIQADDRIELKGKNKVTGVQEVIETSLLYTFLKGINAKLIPIEMDIFLLAVQDLNRYYYQDLKDDVNAKVIRDKCINAIKLCVECLIKKGEWTHVDAKEFYVDLSVLQEKQNSERKEKESAGKEEVTFDDSTPIDLLISSLHVTAYSSDDIQEFIKEVVTDTQFRPVKNIVKDKSLTDAEKQEKIAKVAAEFFTKTEKMSYKLMSEPTSFLNILLSIVKPKMVLGAKHFQENTISTAAVFLRKLRKLHLECFEVKQTKIMTTRLPDSKNEPVKKAGGNPAVILSEDSDEKEKGIEKKHKTKHKKVEIEKEEAVIEVIHKSFTVSGVEYNASFAVEITGKSKIIQSITIDQDVYLFVQTVKNPEDKPDYSQKISSFPLFKIAYTSETNFVGLQQAGDEIRDAVALLIEKQQYGCTVHTALNQRGETLLIEIIWQIGNMLSVNALLGAIKTYITSKETRNVTCCTSKPKYDLVELEAYLTAAYVSTTNSYLSKFWRESFFKRQNVKSLRTVEKKITGVSMGGVKGEVIQSLEEDATENEPAFIWLLRSICETFIDPQGKLQTELAPKKKATNKGLQLEECIYLLQKELTEGRQKVTSGWLDVIVTGIWNTIVHEKPDTALSFIKGSFKSLDDFPSAKIEKIIGENIPSKKKAVEIFKSIFEMESLGLKKEATKENGAAIATFLNKF